MANKINKDNVEVILQSNPDGLTIREIADASELTRQTVATILAEFKGAEKITERLVGQAKLIYWKVYNKTIDSENCMCSDCDSFQKSNEVAE